MKTRDLLERILANWPAKVISIAAAILLLLFNRMNNLQERSLVTTLEVILPDGYAAAAPYQEKVSITVKGENEEAIGRIQAADFRVYLDLSEVVEEGEFTSTVRYTRQGPALATGTFVEQVEPSEVSIYLEREIGKILSVGADIRGSPDAGYSMVGYALEPEELEIRGPRSHVEAIDVLSTEEIDISGRNEDFVLETTVAVSDPLVRMRGGGSVEFRATIRQIIVSRRFTNVSVVGYNLDPKLVWSSDTPSGSVTVIGPQLVVNALSSTDVALYVSFADIQVPGDHRLEVRANAPSKLNISGYSPREIEVTLEPEESTGEPL